MIRYETHIGLEIHIHLLTRTKMFCGCAARFGDEPNTNVCPVCMGWPGTLPMLSGAAVELGYRTAHALGCTLSRQTVFARKQYFYPDMPKNYQISQFHDPVGRDGLLEVPMPDGGVKTVRIRECHLEEDAGKMIHAGEISLLDYNRAGFPLLEIVTEPDLGSGAEAEEFLRYFRRLVRYLGVSDGNMEEGSLRCDANISVAPEGAGLGTKVEIKNLNSSRFVRLALEHERDRQTALLTEGGTVLQETRLWNENRDRTEPMRTKESSRDYRYFPEPDLPPFVPTERFLTMIGLSVPELPAARAERFVREYGLSPELSGAVTEDRAEAEFFERTVRRAVELTVGRVPPDEAIPDGIGREIALWMTGELRKVLGRAGVTLSGSLMTSDRLAQIVALLRESRINGKVAKRLVSEVVTNDAEPLEVVVREGLELLSSEEAILPYVERVLSAEREVTAAVLAGDAAKKEYLIGKVMAETGGRAEPSLVRGLIDRCTAGESAAKERR
jgi:aspartyl-tRNA(Asn)/glutamyl-tRNA(Gln) amidotransferase subunit B